MWKKCLDFIKQLPSVLFIIFSIVVGSFIVHYLKITNYYKNIWIDFIVIYLCLAVFTFVPTLKAIFKRIKLHPGGDSFNTSLHFTEAEKSLLEQHYSRIQGTLVFWKNQAEKYRNFHYYCLFWTIPSSIMIPIIIQAMNNSNVTKILLTIISTHTAILIAFHRGFKVEENFKAFRLGESEFYDTYRRILDQPITFGETHEEQLQNYFKQVEQIRKLVRNAETDNFPTVDNRVDKKNQELTNHLNT
ncbi:DUF4231 domain-containing protein [Clostridium estertheticum]|uniref:DUF4231 domain-containing protein n=1 Tax=Clostridium estertheticum TaxID=238834 RepID=UPI001C7DF545|nr:DUF4231 domain-containing protein [Clostridium estertheticum]MBX4267551.1 DUF4231 domain-containing protein [Clostridium estertheticum]WLC88635.1 DUF4231 domain-containing protein [Clostridium estertheticum]